MANRLTHRIVDLLLKMSGMDDKSLKMAEVEWVKQQSKRNRYK